MSDTPGPYVLARMADVADPDGAGSPGSDWLQLVYSDAVEMIEDHGGDAYAIDSDDVWERADQIVPIYTHHRWQVFVDLAAYQEEVTEYGPIEDLTTAAGVALYMIASRLYDAVIEEAREEATE